MKKFHVTKELFASRQKLTVDSIPWCGVSRPTFLLVALQKSHRSEEALVEKLKQLKCSCLDVDSRAAAYHHRDCDYGSVVIARVFSVGIKSAMSKFSISAKHT